MQTAQISSIEVAVSRAACWLDRRDPEWFDHVDPLILNMRSYSGCVLGQLASRLVGRTHTRRGKQVHFRHAYTRNWAAVRPFKRAFFDARSHQLWVAEITARRRDQAAFKAAQAEARAMLATVGIEAEPFQAKVIARALVDA